ncbi:hypothetical protein ACWDRB_32260 [Nonomuraea sp. NPDC003707]
MIAVPLSLTASAAEEPRAPTMLPVVLLARTRMAFLLARASIVANNRPEMVSMKSQGKQRVGLGA